MQSAAPQSAALRTAATRSRGEPCQGAPFTDEPQRALDSLGRIEDLEVAWVLPGHGAPWHGSPRDLVAAVRSAAA